jgi:ATP-binding cassette subfamily B protein
MIPDRIDSWRANGRVYVRLTELLRPHWQRAVGAMFCVCLATGFALAIPWLLAWVVDVGLRRGHGNDLMLAALVILAASIMRGLSAYGQSYLAQSTSQLVAYDLRNRIYDHLQKLGFSFYNASETGQLMSNLTVDIEAVRNFIVLGLLRAAVTVATFVPIAIILFRLDWQLALITLICVPVLAILSITIARRLRPLWLAVQDETGGLSTIMQESLSGARVVKAFAREEYEIKKFDTQNQVVRGLSLDAMRLSAWNQPLMVLVLNLVSVAVVWLGGVAVINHRLSLGTLVAVVQYVLVLGTPVRVFGFMVTWFTRGLSGGTRIFEVLDTEPNIADAPGAVTLDHIRGHVRFEDVSFAYGEGPDVLGEIEIDARPGQIIALLGATGSGKSTILHLIPRFYDVTGGRVSIDGQDVREVTLSSLRSNIGLVLQDTFLFNATLRDNIAYGVAGASDEQVFAAARAARLHDFALALPDGYGTWVGERGVTLSGGQKQRVAIARTLLRDPRILILDDATSSVDMETEYLIQQALAEVMRGRTTFVVASRLRTVKNADQILVLDDGRIVERGTHEELLARGGMYRRLYDLQLREQEEYEERMLAINLKNGAAR